MPHVDDFLPVGEVCADGGESCSVKEDVAACEEVARGEEILRGRHQRLAVTRGHQVLGHAHQNQSLCVSFGQV